MSFFKSNNNQNKYYVYLLVNKSNLDSNENNSITTKNFTTFIMYKLNKRMIMLLNENDKWVEAEPEDQKEIATAKETKEYLSMKPEDYNKIVGYPSLSILS